LLTVPLMLSAFILFNIPALSQPSEQTDYEEVFSSEDPDGIIFIDWQAQNVTVTNELSCKWFLGAYRFNDGSLSIDLDRKFLLSNDVFYVINYAESGSASAVADRLATSLSSAPHNRSAALFLNLCDTSGVVLVESGNLLTDSNVVRYVISSDMEGQPDNAVILVKAPTAAYPSAAVLQLRPESDTQPYSDNASVIVHESLLLADTYADYLASYAQNNSSTNYNGTGSLSNFYDQVNGSGGNSSTNNSGGGGGGNGGGNGGGGRGEKTEKNLL